MATVEQFDLAARATQSIVSIGAIMFGRASRDHARGAAMCLHFLQWMAFPPNERPDSWIDFPSLSHIDEVVDEVELAKAEKGRKPGEPALVSIGSFRAPTAHTVAREYARRIVDLGKSAVLQGFVADVNQREFYDVFCPGMLFIDQLTWLGFEHSPEQQSSIDELNREFKTLSDPSDAEIRNHWHRISSFLPPVLRSPNWVDQLSVDPTAWARVRGQILQVGMIFAPTLRAYARLERDRAVRDFAGEDLITWERFCCAINMNHDTMKKKVRNRPKPIKEKRGNIPAEFSYSGLIAWWQHEYPREGSIPKDYQEAMQLADGEELKSV